MEPWAKYATQESGPWAKYGSKPDLGSDLLKSADAGVARGVAGIGGLFGDVTNLGATGIEKATDFVTDTLGMERAPRRDRSQSVLNAIPTSESIQKSIQKEFYGGAPEYQPQTKAGQYARTAGEFAPGIIGGGGLMQLGKRALTNVAAPAVASEAAGQATDGTDAEPYARVAAALAGGGAASRLATGRQKGIAAPTQEQLETAKTAAYQSPEVTSLRVHPQGASELVDDIKASLLQNKVDELNAPKVSGIIERIRNPRFDKAHSIDDFDLARQSLKDVPFEERRAAGIVRKEIDRYLGSIPQRDVVAGNAAAANRKLLEARANTAALKRDEEIANALGRAENQAASANSGANLENATRQQLRPILNDKQGLSKAKKVFQDYTPEEISALRKAVVGTPYSNFVRSAGKYLGGGGGLGGLASGSVAGATASSSGADPLSSVGVGILTALGGRGLNAYGNRMAAKRAQEVSELLRKRSPLHQSNVAANPVSAVVLSEPKKAALIAAILSGQQQPAFQQR